MPKAIELIFATTNAGKARELRAYLADLPVTVHTLADLSKPPTVVEDRPTLKGNAQKKAETLHNATGLPTLADDTGLEVDALDGAPGVYSARFAGEAADDTANRAKLLSELRETSKRTARFRTVLAFVESDTTSFFEGICEGVITKEERGSGGFGYDSIFQPTGHNRTFAEITKEEKNVISHRGQALKKFAQLLNERLNS